MSTLHLKTERIILSDAAQRVCESGAGLLLCNGARLFDENADVQGFQSFLGIADSWQSFHENVERLERTDAWGLMLPYREALGENFTDESLKALPIKPIHLTAQRPQPYTLNLTFSPQMPWVEYEKEIAQIHEVIRAGEYYEINLCMLFEAEVADFEAAQAFTQILYATRARFGALMKDGEDVYLCGSPERFFKVSNGIIRTEPIKGTAPRHWNEQIERELAADLARSEKERAENLMIVDLMRHDLSHFCKPSSILVEELWGVRTYPTVHQMTSVVRGEIEKGTAFTKIIDHLSPAGSMTGAPKSRVMEAILGHETSPRGIYSGSIGYLTQQKEGQLKADMNVVIRTLHYNQRTKKLRFHVGSAVTLLSRAETEWQECLHKAEALVKSLGCRIEA